MGDKWIKIALEVNQNTRLTQININLDIEDVLKGICEEHGLPYERGKYALKVQDISVITGTEYVTDKNKSELKHGLQLRLTRSPSERAAALIENLRRSTVSDALKHLRSLSYAAKDRAMLEELHKQNALQQLRVFASARGLTEDEYYRHYRVIGEFLARDYVKQLLDDEVQHLIDIITCDGKETREMLSLAFELLILLRKKGKLYWPMKLLRKLTPYVRLYDEHKLQERSIQLINYLYLYSNDEEERKVVLDFMKSSIMITYINKYVIREHLSDSMKHQLYLYHTIILRRYNKQLEIVDLKVGKIIENLEYVISNMVIVNQVRQMRTSGESVARDGMKLSPTKDRDRAHQILRSLKLTLTPMTRHRSISGPCTIQTEKTMIGQRCGSHDDVGENSEPEFFRKKIEERRELSREKSLESADGNLGGYSHVGAIPREAKSEVVESVNLSDEQVSALARDNLYYFIINDFEGFEQLLTLHKGHLKSILRLSIGVTNMLCKIFEIQKKEPEIKRGRFVPLCFLYYDYFIEKIFCVMIKLFHRTRHEMRIAVDSDEFSVVLRTVQDQLIWALEKEPVEFLELEARLNELNLKVVQDKRKEFIRDEIERQLTEAPPFVELKEIVTPRIMDKIKEKRIQFMESGEHAQQYDQKGQKIAGKKWFISIAKTHDKIHIDECTDDPCRGKHRLLETVSICDIREIEYGSKSNFYKEVYFNLYSERDMFFRPGIKQQEPDLEFPISLKLHSLNYVDFCAGSKLSLDYWVDGLNILTGEKMNSAVTTEELNYLLDIELMYHLAELEGIKLPDKPPPIPSVPLDYNFATP